MPADLSQATQCGAPLVVLISSLKTANAMLVTGCRRKRRYIEGWETFQLQPYSQYKDGTGPKLLVTLSTLSQFDYLNIIVEEIRLFPHIRCHTSNEVAFG